MSRKARGPRMDELKTGKKVWVRGRIYKTDMHTDYVEILDPPLPVVARLAFVRRGGNVLASPQASATGGVTDKQVREMLNKAYPAWVTGFGKELPVGLCREFNAHLQRESQPPDRELSDLRERLRLILDEAGKAIRTGSDYVSIRQIEKLAYLEQPAQAEAGRPTAPATTPIGTPTIGATTVAGGEFEAAAPLQGEQAQNTGSKLEQLLAAAERTGIEKGLEMALEQLERDCGASVDALDISNTGEAAMKQAARIRLNLWKSNIRALASAARKETP
jgi:hypothetical protein